MGSASNHTFGTLSSAPNGSIIEHVYAHVRSVLLEFNVKNDENENAITNKLCKALEFKKPPEYPYFFHHQNIEDENEFPFNILKLQYLLESMIELKRFHLYAKLNDNRINRETILLEFQNQYWLNHNWIFGIHGNYFYTLPFHFDQLYQCVDALNDVKSNNSEILTNNHRIWYYVKSIHLPDAFIYDRNFIKQVEMKIPKLNFIKFIDDSFTHKDKRQQLLINNDEIEKNNVRLYNVKTIEFVHSKSFEKKEEWLINLTPNLNHLILSNQQYPLVENRLTSIFNKQIQRLDIDVNFQLDDLASISYVYFSNVQYINLIFREISKRPQWYEHMIIKILENFKNLKILIIYSWPERTTVESLLNRHNLYKNEILTNFEVKHFRRYSTFSKRTFYK